MCKEKFRICAIYPPGECSNSVKYSLRSRSRKALIGDDTSVITKVNDSKKTKKLPDKSVNKNKLKPLNISKGQQKSCNKENEENLPIICPQSKTTKSSRTAIAAGIKTGINKLKSTPKKNILISAVDKPNAKLKKLSKGQRFRKSDSFQRYGLILPSYDKIIENMNRVQKDSKVLDNFEKQFEKNDSFLNEHEILSKFDISSSSAKELLDCKHLDNDDLKQYFCNNLSYINNIFKGILYSERHEMYQLNLVSIDLTYSSSLVAFSAEQIEYLLGLMEDEFDINKNYTDYYMKVLLPELCLKIFMDEHNMTNNEANAYLDWRPAD